jgi:hypothetical protein
MRERTKATANATTETDPYGMINKGQTTTSKATITATVAAMTTAGIISVGKTSKVAWLATEL